MQWCMSFDCGQLCGRVGGEIDLVVDEFGGRVSVSETKVSRVCSSTERYNLFRGFRAGS